MPINWNVQFEQPIIKLLDSGQIRTTDELVDNITKYYDLAIKSGAPVGPGLPAGPVIQSNIQGFKRSLRIYYKVQKAKLFYQEYKKYLNIIFILHSKLSALKGELMQLKQESSSIQSQINSTFNANSNTNNTLNVIDNGFNLKLLSKKRKVDDKILEIEYEIASILSNKLKSIKTEIISLSNKIITPHNTNKNSKSKLQSIIKNKLHNNRIITNLINLDIKEAKNNIKSSYNSIISIMSQIQDKDLSNLIKSIPKKINNLNDLKSLLSNIDAAITSIPNSVLSIENKLIIKRELIHILNAQSEIINLTLYVESNITKKIQSEINYLKSKFNLPVPVSKINKFRNNIKHIKRISSEILYYKNQLLDYQKLALDISKEINKLKLMNQNDYIRISTNLLKLIQLRYPDYYDKLKSSIKVSNVILILSNLTIILSNDLINLESLFLRSNEFKKSLLSYFKRQFINPKRTLFLNFLKISLLQYWSGAVLTNSGIVTYPGNVLGDIKLSPSNSSNDSIKELSKIFQIHLKSISGTYTTPAGVTVTWVGYF